MAPSQDFSAAVNRSSRGMSIGGKSHISHRSTGSGSSLKETHEEKAKRTLRTKADPTLAINEAQPMAVALEKSNMTPLRSMQHRDQFGNVITDPDLSNPTRPRFERPLDTIRSFEAAIDGSYNSRRMSYAATDAASNAGYNSRRASYFGNNHGPHFQESRRAPFSRRPASMPSADKHSLSVAAGWQNASTVSFHRGYSDQAPNSYRQSYPRPDSFVESYGNPNVYQQQHTSRNPYNQYGVRPQRPRNDYRMSTDYANGGGQNFYPQQAYQHSNDNVTAGSGSNNTDQFGNSTDPSSVNSSLDRLQQQLQANSKQEYQQTDTYGINGFGPAPQLEAFKPYENNYDNTPPPPPPHGYINGGGYRNINNGYSNGTSNSYTVREPAPPPPAKDYRNSTMQPPVGRKGTLRKNSTEKRQSWFKKRFSKS